MKTCFNGGRRSMVIERPPLCVAGSRAHHTKLGQPVGGIVPARCSICGKAWRVITFGDYTDGAEMGRMNLSSERTGWLTWAP